MWNVEPRHRPARPNTVTTSSTTTTTVAPTTSAKPATPAPAAPRFVGGIPVWPTLRLRNGGRATVQARPMSGKSSFRARVEQAGKLYRREVVLMIVDFGGYEPYQPKVPGLRRDLSRRDARSEYNDVMAWREGMYRAVGGPRRPSRGDVRSFR